MLSWNNTKIVLLGFVGAMLFSFVKEGFIGNAQSKSGLSVINASGINLVDDSGKIRIQLGFSKEGPPGFWIFDDKGVVRLAAGLYPDGTSHFGLQDKNGLMVSLLRSIGESESPLLIFKNRGSDKMIMGLNAKDNNPFLMSYEKTGKKMHFGNYDGQ